MDKGREEVLFNSVLKVVEGHITKEAPNDKFWEAANALGSVLAWVLAGVYPEHREALRKFFDEACSVNLEQMDAKRRSAFN